MEFFKKFKLKYLAGLFLFLMMLGVNFRILNVAFAEGTDCRLGEVTCAADQRCSEVNGVCIDIKKNDNSSGNTTNPKVDCGKEFDNVNGVCVPKSDFNSNSLAGKTTWQELVLQVLKVLLTLAGVAAVVAIVIGGFWYITSGGNEETAEKGRSMLTNAIIGLVIVILAFVIVTVVTNLLTKGPA